MSYADAEQLVRDAMDFTGAAPPSLFDEDAPVLRGDAAGAAGDLYLIGLIGGKEVGKSALVNALAGAPITEQTSHGPGTQIAVAYVHRSRVSALTALMDRVVPNQYRLVPHDEPRLSRQVLVDLPDIDSRFKNHLELTRKMLRHMLFPLWIQSVEKYADAQPQALLAAVAAGNDPSNFLFCLNKVDYLSGQRGQAEELRDDFAQRIGKTLALPQPPRVYLISATHPNDHDLPELTALLSREKSGEIVAESAQLAQRRRLRTLIGWLGDQDLPGRAQRLARLDEQASELLAERVGVPVLERIIPGIFDDLRYRLLMTDGVFATRVARWPIVSVLHALISPLRWFVRENTAPGAFFGGAAAVIDAHLPLGTGSVAGAIQSAFAQLHQSNPGVSALYSTRRYWESMDADAAQADLREQLIQTVENQRETVRSRLAGKTGIVAPFVRVLLTVGALLWFPFIQPVLQAILISSTFVMTLHNAGFLLVQTLSSQFLLRSAVFLLLWYFLIWALLRWGTRRKVERLLHRWRSLRQPDPLLNPNTRAIEWLDALRDPIHQARERAQALSNRLRALQDLSSDGTRSAA